MECEHAYPTGIMNGFQMRVAAFFCDFIRDVVNGDDAVEKDDSNENQHP